MASEVKTNKISPATSTTINVGDSGDTLALAVDDVTGFNVGSDAAGDVLYNDGTDYTRLAKPGTPADEVLTFATGASAPSWVAVPAGGITHASQWRVTADFLSAAAPITANLEEVDAPLGYGKLPASGGSMTVASGNFTFPVTGTWKIEFVVFGSLIQYVYQEASIGTTTDDSTYATAARAKKISPNYAVAGNYNMYLSCIFNVTDVANDLCNFNINPSSGLIGTYGDTNQNETYMTFTRLGDST